MTDSYIERCDRLMKALDHRANRKIGFDVLNIKADCRMILITDEKVRLHTPWAAFIFYADKDHGLIAFLDETGKPSEDEKFLNEAAAKKLYSYIDKSKLNYKVENIF